MTPSFESWRDSGRRFPHHGHSIFWQSGGNGSGDALVCIHGFPTASWDWHALWPDLCAHFGRVLAPDMIGFGWSAKPRDYAYSILDQADLHEALLRHEGIARYHILAHDYGDTVAQELLARHEERKADGDGSLRLQSLCLLNGGLFPESHRPRTVQKLLLTPLGPLLSALMSERSFARSFAAVFGPATRPGPEEMHRFWQLVAHAGGNRIAHQLIHYMPERRRHRERWVGALQRTGVPLRVIDGPEDPVSGAHMVQRYRELVPNPDTVLLPGIGHYPQVEDPRGTLAAFMAFHDRLAAG
ncbi:MAG: alpha/beta hydrolase [Nevskia sp.]|nr:alpha/beta hydrolase [Nevskia sp.]